MVGASRGRGRITVIDDDPDFLDLMQDLLSDKHDVVTFSGREIGPENIVESQPDLLIVDLRLGARDPQGRDVVTLARAHRRLREIPIIVCSADHLGLSRQTAAFFSMGNTAVLAKPFSLDEFERLVSHGIIAGYPGSGFDVAGQDGLSDMLEASADAILICDGTGRYVDANDVALQLVGLDRDELLRLTVADLVADEHAWTEAEWERYRRDGWWHGPVVLSIKGGRTQPMFATARVVSLGDHPAFVSWLQPIGQGVT